MAKIIWTSEAERWVKDIFKYISQDNQDAAEQVVNGIYDRAQMLLPHPVAGYVYEHEPEDEIRILLYGHYRTTCLIDTDKNIVILGVFHGALEIESYLKNEV